MCFIRGGCPGLEVMMASFSFSFVGTGFGPFREGIEAIQGSEFFFTGNPTGS